ncbi:hypothetical protein BGZ49_006464, partial [Haplosporangium sp. Z 27]
MSTDASRIDTAMLSMLLVVSVPIYTIIIVGLLIHLMGPSALLGAAILVFANPIQAWAMSRLAPIRKRASQFTDSRIRLTQEILQGIKVITFVTNSTLPNPPPAWHGYGLAVAMVCLTLCQNVFYQRWNLGSVTMGIYIRAALIDL